MRETDADVAVIGGGMVGLATALECLARGRSVALIDPDDARARTSFGNAGVISRGSILPVASPFIWKSFARYARNADPAVRIRYTALFSALPWLRVFLSRANEASWREAAAALHPLTSAAYDEHIRVAETIGARDLIRRTGWIKLYRTEAAFETYRLERDILAEHGVAMEILDGAEVARAEPVLTRRYARAMLLPESGSVNYPGALVERYRSAFLERGGRLIAAKADRIEPTEDDVRVGYGGGSIVVRQAVLSAGARSAALARQLGYRFPMAAERGYHRHYHVPANLTRPVYDTGGSYILAPMGDTVRVSSGIEIARPDDPPNHAQITAVTTDAAQTMPLGAPVEGEVWHGSRPSTPDGMPIIGRAPRHPNVIFAFGHGHIGLSTGPITGRIAADLVDQRTPPIPVAPFGPERLLGMR